MTWMPGTRPGMTRFANSAHSIGCLSSQTLTMRFQLLMVRSAATPRVSNHGAVGITPRPA
jgi:hypothetical protein